MENSTITIDVWLERFRLSWIAHDVERVMELFADDVEYWETPHARIESKQALQNEWQAILEQAEIAITTDVFVQENGRYAIRWRLTYLNSSDDMQEWAGTYLVELDEVGLCRYFYQTGEKLEATA